MERDLERPGEASESNRGDIAEGATEPRSDERSRVDEDVERASESESEDVEAPE